MKYLVLLLIGASVSYGQDFNGTVFDLDTGRIQVVTGSLGDPWEQRKARYEAMIQRTREDRMRIQAETDRMWAEAAARRSEYYLREQTELLRQIAEKQ